MIRKFNTKLTSYQINLASSATLSATMSDYDVYILNCNAGNVALTLLSPTVAPRKRITVMRNDTYQHSSAYKGLVVAPSGYSINGVGVLNLANYDSVSLYNNGTNWVIIGGGMS